MIDDVDARYQQGHRPLVTVLMSVFNGETYLQEAIDSITNQTFHDFEFLVINDASTDGTRAILQRANDPRIRVIENSTNLGLTKSLNKGLALARGELIARIDADDIAAPGRLQAQAKYLCEHARCGIVFSGFRMSSGYVSIPPETVTEQRWELLFDNPMAHSSAMYRREIILHQVGGYDESFRVSQDYELWIRASACGVSMGVVPEVLVFLRVHAGSVSCQFALAQQQRAEELARREIEKICPGMNGTMVQAMISVWRQGRTAHMLLTRPIDAWRLRKSIQQLIQKFAAIHRLGEEWQDAKALAFAVHGAADVIHCAAYRWRRIGLLYELLGSLPLSPRRPGYSLSVLVKLLVQLLKKARNRFARQRAAPLPRMAEHPFIVACGKSSFST